MITYQLTGSDVAYYRILREAGYSKSSHIPSNAEGWPVLARLREQVAEVKYRADEAEAIRAFGGG